MNRVLYIFIGVLLCQEGLSQDEWVLKKNKDEITIYTRERTGSPLKEYRASAIIRQPIAAVFQFLTDIERRPDWVINCTGITIIDTTSDGRIRYHTGYDIPWPLAARDVVVASEFSFDPEKGKAHLITLPESLDYPLKKGVIRMPDYREEVFLEAIDAGQTEYRTEGYADPGGKVPPWAVNLFLVDGIYDSVIETRKAVRRMQNQGL
jgi:hypothetical protein